MTVFKHNDVYIVLIGDKEWRGTSVNKTIKRALAAHLKGVE